MPLLAEHNMFVQQAAREVAKRARGLRGNPGEKLLRRYVEALVALIQETTGKPVLSMRDKNSVYEPQLVGKSGELIRLVVHMLGADLTETRLAYWIREIRRERAGKPMRFMDYFPAYGARTDGETGPPVLAGTHRIERVDAITPISCP